MFPYKVIELSLASSSITNVKFHVKIEESPFIGFLSQPKNHSFLIAIDLLVDFMKKESSVMWKLPFIL